MIKRPDIRKPCIALVAQKSLDELQADFEWATEPLAFRVLEFEITGGAAKGTWHFLHSDLDVNFRTADCGEARKLWRAYPEKSQETMRRFRKLWDKWGVRIDIMMKFTDMRNVLDESFYGLKERKHYRPEMTADTRGARLPRPDTDWLALNDEGELVLRHDPWAKQVI